MQLVDEFCDCRFVLQRGFHLRRDEGTLFASSSSSDAA
jgi:hypothetical protein